jgi:hypothetical protein
VARPWPRASPFTCSTVVVDRRIEVECFEVVWKHHWEIILFTVLRYGVDLHGEKHLLATFFFD